MTTRAYFKGWNSAMQEVRGLDLPEIEEKTTEWAQVHRLAIELHKISTAQYYLGRLEAATTYMKRGNKVDNAVGHVGASKQPTG